MIPARFFGKLILCILGISALLSGCHNTVSAPKISSGVGELRVEMEGFPSDDGVALVSLFATAEGFPDETLKALANAQVTIHQRRARAVFPTVPYGYYALSVLHDADGDGAMATGALGVPREAHGVSNNPDSRFARPEFSEARFLLLSPERVVRVHLHSNDDLIQRNYWQERTKNARGN